MFLKTFVKWLLANQIFVLMMLMKVGLRVFKNKNEAVNYLKQSQITAGLFSKNFGKAPTFFIIFLRLIAPVFIFFQPLLIFLIVSFLDWLDFFILINTGIKLKEYQLIDKSLDLYSQFFMMLYGLETGYSLIFFFLFFYRLLGTIAFLITLRRLFLLVFPNLIEVIFLTYVLSFYFGLGFLSIFGILATLKMIQEFRLYYFSIRIPLVILQINTKRKSFQIQVARNI